MMYEREFSVTRVARTIAVFFALLAALVALQAVGTPKSAEAGDIGGTGSWTFVCPIPLIPSMQQLNWTGTDSNNEKCGSMWDDYMDGRGGDDELYGQKASDSLIGGTGNDTLVGDPGCFDCTGGADKIVPGDGADQVYGGVGGDTITVYADGQPDAINGEEGTDTLRLMSCHLDSTDTTSGIELVSKVQVC